MKNKTMPLPCPFCGAVAKKLSEPVYCLGQIEIKKNEYVLDHVKGCWIGDIFAGGRMVILKGKMKKWNRRMG